MSPGQHYHEIPNQPRSHPSSPYLPFKHLCNSPKASSPGDLGLFVRRPRRVTGDKFPHVSLLLPSVDDLVGPMGSPAGLMGLASNPILYRSISLVRTTILKFGIGGV